MKGGWSVPDAAHIIISEYASAEMLTGQMHLYRGVLNDKGKAYLKLFKVCTAKLRPLDACRRRKLSSA